MRGAAFSRRLRREMRTPRRRTTFLGLLARCRVAALSLVLIPALAEPSTRSGPPLLDPEGNAEAASRLELDDGHLPIPLPEDDRVALADAVALAAERDPRRALFASRRDEISVLNRDARRWLADPPRVVLALTSDAVGSDDGYRQWDAVLELPLLWLGQKGARGKVAEVSRQALHAAETALLLTAAGEVRDAIARLALARTRFERAQRTLEISDALVRDVERAVELGELARLDWLAVLEASLDHRQSLVEAEARLFDAALHWRSLTGMDRVPAQWREAPAPGGSITHEHPFLAAAEEFLHRAKAELTVAKRDQWSGPEIAIGTQHERALSGTSYSDRLIAGVRIPFGRGGGALARIAQALVLVGDARSTVAAQRRALELALHEAQHQLKTAAATLEASGERAGVASERRRLARRAFDLGEIGMAELLRSQARAADAERQLEEAGVSREHAIAQLNQALGVIP